MRHSTPNSIFQHFFISVILLAFQQQVWAQNFYDTEEIVEIELSFFVSDWQADLETLFAAGNEERLLGQATINGEAFANVGVRYKGSSSFLAGQPKNPLNIKLDYTDPSQSIDGITTLKLSNGFRDPSFVREVLCYEIARNYLEAPRANFARVTVNGEYIGLYSNIESINKGFLDRRFDSNNNTFVKGDDGYVSGQAPGCPSGPEGPRLYSFGTDTSCYTNYYEMISDNGIQPLVDFILALDEDLPNIEDVLDVDRALWLHAFNNILVNLDSPLGSGNNYYLYEDDDNEYNVLPWDLNECLGIFDFDLNFTEQTELSPFLNESDPNYPFFSQLMLNPRYKRMYIAHYRTILEEHFSSSEYLSRSAYLQTLIESDVLADENKFYSNADFNLNLSSNVGGIVGISQLITPRITYLESALNPATALPEITNPTTNPVSPEFGDQLTISAEVTDASTVILAYRYSKFEKYEKANMFNTGGDIFSANIWASGPEIQYYIYAESDLEARFSPARAGMEYHTSQVNINFPEPGNLVINECMAKNNSTQADEAGEFDDWIELYNNSESPINLAGYTITDQTSNLAKWSLPNIVIPANGYQTIWVDKDESQGELHANFKLSGGGEYVILADSNGEILDFLLFGVQTSDISIGRYENGTGSFVNMSPTFGSENNPGFVGIETTLATEVSTFSVFPNPSTDWVQINSNSKLKNSFVLYSSLGMQVKEFDLEPNASFQLNLDGLASGIYMLLDKSGKLQKLIKQ